MRANCDRCARPTHLVELRITERRGYSTLEHAYRLCYWCIRGLFLTLRDDAPTCADCRKLRGDLARAMLTSPFTAPTIIATHCDATKALLI